MHYESGMLKYPSIILLALSSTFILNSIFVMKLNFWHYMHMYYDYHFLAFWLRLWVAYVYEDHILMNWSFDWYKVMSFIPLNNFGLKVYFFLLYILRYEEMEMLFVEGLQFYSFLRIYLVFFFLKVVNSLCFFIVNHIVFCDTVVGIGIPPYLVFLSIACPQDVSSSIAALCNFLQLP